MPVDLGSRWMANRHLIGVIWGSLHSTPMWVQIRGNYCCGGCRTNSRLRPLTKMSVWNLPSSKRVSKLRGRHNTRKLIRSAYSGSSPMPCNITPVEKFNPPLFSTQQKLQTSMKHHFNLLENFNRNWMLAQKIL